MFFEFQQTAHKIRDSRDARMLKRSSGGVRNRGRQSAARRPG